MSIDLKTLTPDTSLPSTAVLFGADSQTATNPSVYPLARVRQFVDARDYGVIADGTTNDTSALQSALTAAAGGTLVLPEGNIIITAPITYDCATLGPIRVIGQGTGTEVRISGTAARAFEFTGTAGVTFGHVQLESFQVVSVHSTTATDGILLDGLAVYSLINIVINGNNKMTNGVRLRGTQQGQISGGLMYLMTDGIVLEPGTGAVASNGCDMHGVSFYATGRNAVLNDTDSVFLTNCHFVNAPVGVDVTVEGNGPPTIANCHIESHTTAGVRSVAPVRILNTNFYKLGSGTDISLTGGVGSIIHGNLLQGNVTIGASCSDTRFTNNLSTGSGTYTNSGTRTIAFGNVGSGPTTNVGTLHDSLSLTSKSGTAGEILTANANGAIGGAWGIGINGAGASQDVYVKYHDAILAGSTAGGILRMKSGVGGTTWASFGGFGIELPEISDPGAPATNNGRLYVRDNGGGKSQLCIRFPTGAVQVIATEP